MLENIVRGALEVGTAVLAFVRDTFRANASLKMENAFLRHQLNIAMRSNRRLQLSWWDRAGEFPPRLLMAVVVAV